MRDLRRAMRLALASPLKKHNSKPGIETQNMKSVCTREGVAEDSTKSLNLSRRARVTVSFREPTGPLVALQWPRRRKRRRGLGLL
jgi:hypothetical protein